MTGTRKKFVQVPVRQYPRVYDQPGVLVQDERALAQPVEKFFCVRGIENLVQSVAIPLLSEIFRACQQVQVMVAEHGPASLSQPPCESQNLKGLRTTVHEIAGEPYTILRPELASHEEALKGVMATLYVADDIGGHGGSVREFRNAGKL